MSVVSVMRYAPELYLAVLVMFAAAFRAHADLAEAMAPVFKNLLRNNRKIITIIVFVVPV